jgi:WD40 repeat protein
VQFNPFYSNYFGAAFDNGTVQVRLPLFILPLASTILTRFLSLFTGPRLQVWDIRKPNAFERRFTAHEGLVMTICWHPEEKSIIASGGRDRLIKVKAQS